MTFFEKELIEQLEARKKINRYRHRRTLASPQAVRVVVDGNEVLNFCSNDYLGLANHSALADAAKQAVGKYGLGGGASHLVCGHSEEHHELEQELAEFTGRDRAILFSTGYMANLGVLQALTGRGDFIFQDKLNHASLLDGAQLSRAKLVRFSHCDISQLAERLQAANSEKRKLIATDGVFSMDGDCAPLHELSKLAQAHRGVLMVDDAHGFGCLGKNGAGLQEQLQLGQAELPILMGTLGKAFGSFGAFVAGGESLIETLVQFSRSYIYTTSMPPAIAAATRASLKLVQAESWRREKLQNLISEFRKYCADLDIPVMQSDTAIQPVLVGDENQAVSLSNYLFEKGYWVTAIRPPTVPERSSRLRVTLTSEHNVDDVARLAEVIRDGLKALKSEHNVLESEGFREK